MENDGKIETWIVNDKEENILYPMIDQVTGAEERTEMFAEMSRRT